MNKFLHHNNSDSDIVVGFNGPSAALGKGYGIRPNPQNRYVQAPISLRDHAVGKRYADAGDELFYNVNGANYHDGEYLDAKAVDVTEILKNLPFDLNYSSILTQLLSYHSNLLLPSDTTSTEYQLFDAAWQKAASEDLEIVEIKNFKSTAIETSVGWGKASEVDRHRGIIIIKFKTYTEGDTTKGSYAYAAMGLGKSGGKVSQYMESIITGYYYSTKGRQDGGLRRDYLFPEYQKWIKSAADRRYGKVSPLLRNIFTKSSKTKSDVPEHVLAAYARTPVTQSKLKNTRLTNALCLRATRLRDTQFKRMVALSTIDKQISALEGKLGTWNSRMDTHNQNIATLNKEKAALATQKKSAEQDIEDFMEALAEIQKEIDLAAQRVAQIDTQIVEAGEKVEEAKLARKAAEDEPPPDDAVKLKKLNEAKKEILNEAEAFDKEVTKTYSEEIQAFKDTEDELLKNLFNSRGIVVDELCYDGVSVSNYDFSSPRSGVITSLVFSTTKPSVILVDAFNKKEGEEAEALIAGPWQVRFTRNGQSMYSEIRLLHGSSIFGWQEAANGKPANLYVHPHSKPIEIQDSSPEGLIGKMLGWTEVCLGEINSVLAMSMNDGNFMAMVETMECWLKSANTVDDWGRNYVFFPPAPTQVKPKPEPETVPVAEPASA